MMAVPPFHWCAMSLTLTAADPQREPVTQGRVVLRIAGEPVELLLTVPEGKVGLDRLLPILQGLTNHITDRAEAAEAAQGRPVTCAKGCGACCRQIVPVSQAEARALGKLVDAMPPDRQAHVRARFATALAALEEKGVLAEIDALRATPGAPARALGLRYFAAGVACPFLEDESCSIHPDRPLVCRQYLVTSPPERCSTPEGGVTPVPLPAQPAAALLQADMADSGVPWLPLVYALIWHEQAPEPGPRRTAPEILQDVIGRLAGPIPPDHASGH